MDNTLQDKVQNLNILYKQRCTSLLKIKHSNYETYLRVEKLLTKKYEEDMLELCTNRANNIN